MADSLFSITTTPPASLKVEVGQTGKFSFTLTSLEAPDKSQDVILQPLLVGLDGKKKEVDWLVPGPGRTLTIAGGKTETVTITVKPVASTPVGENTIELAIADKDATNDVYVYSSPVTCEVVGKPGVKDEPKRKFPLWLLAVIIGGVLVLGGAAFAIWQLTKGGGGPPGLQKICKLTDAPACADDLVCSPETGTCLRPGGGACTDGTVCDSSECVAGKGVCATRLGGACDAATIEQVPCPKDSHCDGATKTCLKNVCKPGELQCTADGRSLSTCQADGTWKSQICPPDADFCRAGRCQCAADKGKPCECGGIVQCDGTCSKPKCNNNCINGQCCVANAGAACGGCGGVVRCDGSCSVATPPNLGGSCGECNGRVTCTGCSNTTPRCPPNFVVEGNQCRERTETTVLQRHQTIPMTCGINTESTIALACGTGRVQFSSLVKNITGGTGTCSGRFASTNTSDCSIRVRLTQPAGFFCTPFTCEMVVKSIGRRPQCVR
jgi:hypothetical protein